MIRLKNEFKTNKNFRNLKTRPGIIVWFKSIYLNLFAIGVFTYGFNYIYHWFFYQSNILMFKP